MNINALSIEKVIHILSSVISNKDILLDSFKEIKIVKKDSPESPFLSTIGITYKGELVINEEFIEKEIVTIDSLRTVLLHELYHPVLGDTLEVKKFCKDDPELNLKYLASNIAQDCRINSFLYNYFGLFLQKDMSFFETFYTKLITDNPENPLNCLYNLLKPNSIFSGSEEDKLLVPHYAHIYALSKNHTISSYKSLYTDILEILRKKADKNNIDEFMQNLLGSHSQELKDMEEEDTREDDLGDELTEYKKGLDKNLGKELVDNLKDEKYLEAGINYNAAYQILTEIEGTDQKIDMLLFKKLSFDSLFSNIRLASKKTTTVKVKKTKIPYKILNRDLLSISLNQIPILWNHCELEKETEKCLLPIYLDVSGSMEQDLPEIIRLILNIDQDIDHVWGFSNEVYKHSLDDLKEFKIKGTGGTDFECIIKHAKAHNHQNLLVITDGYAHCRHPKEVIQGIDDVIVILTSKNPARDNWFSLVYKNTKDIGEVTID